MGRRVASSKAGMTRSMRSAVTPGPVDTDLHAVAVAAFRDTIESPVSLVDRTSFAFMRREGIERAIALDIDFRTAGFETLP